MIKLIKSTFFNEADTKTKLTNFVMGAEQLSFGAQSEKFEAAFTAYQGRAHSVFVNSGSSANLALIQALLNLGRLKKGDAVGFSAVTWATNVMPIIQLGLQPVPIDVEVDTLNVSSAQLKKTLESTPLKAVFITNLLGWCHDLGEIATLCERENIILIEDNCESMGSEHVGKKLGNFGIASTFSFYVGHHMSTIEGGMVATDDEELATMLVVVRAHGWDRNLSLARQEKIRSEYNINSSFYSRYTFYDLGYNFRPTEISGFLGTLQLQYMPEIIQKRSDNYDWLSERIFTNKTKDLYFTHSTKHMSVFSNFAFPLVCKTVEVRDNLIKKCNELIEIRPIVGGDMTEQPFFSKYTSWSTPLPNAQLLHKQGLYFGNNPDLNEEELELLASTFS